MVKKLLWVLAMVGAAFVASGIVDARRAKRRRELWAEATDRP